MTPKQLHKTTGFPSCHEGWSHPLEINCPAIFGYLLDQRAGQPNGFILTFAIWPNKWAQRLQKIQMDLANGRFGLKLPPPLKHHSTPIFFHPSSSFFRSVNVLAQSAERSLPYLHLVSGSLLFTSINVFEVSFVIEPKKTKYKCTVLLHPYMYVPYMYV